MAKAKAAEAKKTQDHARQELDRLSERSAGHDRRAGPHKLHSTVTQPDNACTRGMIFKVKHLVTVEEV
jgi:hypothetical protein